MSSSKSEIIIGHNDFKYKVNHDWVAPNNRQFPLKDAHEMVLSKSGQLYLLGNETQNNVIIFDKDGNVKGSWGHGFPGGHGLSLHDENGEEFLYLTDTERAKVFKTTLNGEAVMEIGYPSAIEAYQSEKDFKPTETLVMPNGDIFVTDGYGLQFVIQYNAKGEYIRHFGGRNGTKSSLDCAHGIALDDRNPNQPTLLVTSRNENAFKRFSLTGDYLEAIAIPGSFVCRPIVHGKNIFAAVFRSGNNMNFGSGYLTILDENNQVVSSPGATMPIYENDQLVPQQQIPDVFVHPHDVCVDEDENLYVPQWNANHVYPIKLTRV